MAFEIETKLKVDSHEQIEQKLDACGAKFLIEKKQTDIYLDSNECGFASGDKALRIRCEESNNKTDILITFKGPKQASDIKKRLEIEFAIGDAGKCEQFFEQLGFKRKIIVEKMRKSYALNNCLVELDTLDGLGTFVEIEGPDSETIKQVKNSLELGNCEHIAASYAKMVLARMGTKL